MKAARAFAALLLGLAGACAPDAPRTPGPEPRAESEADRDTWWNTATQWPSGKERILAPRELRALLAEGRARGFDEERDWWDRRSRWAYERILALDPDDVEANAGTGRETLQSIPGFEAVWSRMERTRVPTEDILALLDQFGPDVVDERPVFLYEQEYAVVRARLHEAAAHLDRLESDPEYAAVQNALRFVRSSFHADYPFLHEKVGPFLVFYAARDLQEIPGEDEAAERERLAGRRDFYRKELAAWTHVYRELVEDMESLYPRLWNEHGPKPDEVFCQWVFRERAAYVDFLARLRIQDPSAPYRHGFYHRATRWAYLSEPAEAKGLGESAAYLGAVQILHRCSDDPEDEAVNWMERSEDYWILEGWPSYMASRRVKKAAVGEALLAAKNGGWPLPPLTRVFERRSRIDQTDAWPAEGIFTDLAWLLVRHLHGKAHREAFERYLIAQVDGSRRGIDWFEECFGVRGTAAWEKLEREAYAGIGKKE